MNSDRHVTASGRYLHVDSRVLVSGREIGKPDYSLAFRENILIRSADLLNMDHFSFFRISLISVFRGRSIKCLSRITYRLLGAEESECI